MLDASNKRLLALLSAPLFTLLSSKLGVTVPLEVQELLVGSVITYLLGSHAKEAIVAKAQAAGASAATAVVTPADAAAALADAPKVAP